MFRTQSAIGTGRARHVPGTVLALRGRLVTTAPVREETPSWAQREGVAPEESRCCGWQGFQLPCWLLLVCFTRAHTLTHSFLFLRVTPVVT